MVCLSRKYHIDSKCMEFQDSTNIECLPEPEGASSGVFFDGEEYDIPCRVLRMGKIFTQKPKDRVPISELSMIIVKEQKIVAIARDRDGDVFFYRDMKIETRSLWSSAKFLISIHLTLDMITKNIGPEYPFLMSDDVFESQFKDQFYEHYDRALCKAASHFKQDGCQVCAILEGQLPKATSRQFLALHTTTAGFDISASQIGIPLTRALMHWRKQRLARLRMLKSA